MCVCIFDSSCNLLTTGLFVSYLNFWATLAQYVSLCTESLEQEKKESKQMQLNRKYKYSIVTSPTNKMYPASLLITHYSFMII